MTDHIQKKTTYEKARDEMPSLQPDIDAHEHLPLEVSMKSVHDHSQEEEERSRMTTTSINYFDSLHLREICNTGNSWKLPNVFRDYHLQAYDPVVDGSGPEFVIAGDIIFVICKSFYLLPFRLDGEFSPLTDDQGSQIIITMKIQFVCYNRNNNSLIIVVIDPEDDGRSVVSLEIESIKAGLTTGQTNICPQDGGMILDWEFDIPNCRGMIFNFTEMLFKIYELKNYSQLFTIPFEGEYSFCSSLRFGGPGNLEVFVMMYDNNFASEEVLLKIYSKHTGQQRKQISIPVYPEHRICYVVLCGTDRILLQQSELGMQILDISASISRIIKTTDIEMAGRPYYLYKRNLFICYTKMKGLHVSNLEGDILVTFQDHRLYMPSLLSASYITNAQDIVISVCRDEENRFDVVTINISSIITGECIAKITAGTSKLRESALRFLPPRAFAYDETTHKIFTGSENGEIYVWSNKFYNDVRMENSYSLIETVESPSSEEYTVESPSSEQSTVESPSSEQSTVESPSTDEEDENHNDSSIGEEGEEP